MSVFRIFSAAASKQRKNYETVYLQFRNFAKRKEQNYETLHNAVTCINTSYFGNVS